MLSQLGAISLPAETVEANLAAVRIGEDGTLLVSCSRLVYPTGDAASPEPYLYVLPPGPVERDGTWNAASFRGAALPLTAFVREADQRAAALAFYRSRRAAAAA